MNQILQVPGESLLALKMGPEEAAETLRMATAVKLYEIGRFSSGSVAELAGVPRVDFLSRLADYGVGTFDITSTELQRASHIG